jgi:hypothetical protein
VPSFQVTTSPPVPLAPKVAKCAKNVYHRPSNKWNTIKGFDLSRLMEEWMSKLQIRGVLVFAMHQLIGTLGVGMAVGPLAFVSFEILRPLNPRLFVSHNVHVLLTELPYFPMQIVLALWCGWSFSRRFHHRSMLWVWVLPFLILCYAVAAVPTLTPDLVFTSVVMKASGNQSPLFHYFGSGCSVENRCFDQLLVVMPFYASVSYSLGALLARRWGAKNHPARDMGGGD